MRVKLFLLHTKSVKTKNSFSPSLKKKWLSDSCLLFKHNCWHDTFAVTLMPIHHSCGSKYHAGPRQLRYWPNRRKKRGPAIAPDSQSMLGLWAMRAVFRTSNLRGDCAVGHS